MAERQKRSKTMTEAAKNLLKIKKTILHVEEEFHTTGTCKVTPGQQIMINILALRHCWSQGISFYWNRGDRGSEIHERDAALQRMVRGRQSVLDPHTSSMTVFFWFITTCVEKFFHNLIESINPHEHFTLVCILTGGSQADPWPLCH